jgi:hypothetical protein
MHPSMPQAASAAAVKTEDPSARPLPEEFRARLLSLRRRGNWNGEGALPVTTGACRAALKFIEAARSREPDLPLPRLAPSVRGAVSLSWKNEHEHLVVSIPSDDPRSVLLHWEGPGGCFENRTVPVDAAVDDVLAFRPR